MGFFDRLSAEINNIFNEEDDNLTINDLNINSPRDDDEVPPLPNQAAGHATSSPPPLTQPQAAPNGNSLFSPRLERLINVAIADGVVTDKERQLLYRKAQEEGVDIDELDMVIEAMLYERKKDIEAASPSIPTPPPTPQAAMPVMPTTPPPAIFPTPPQSSTKYGEVRKCPGCGKFVRSFEAICSECGFEFAGVEENSSILRLQSKLDSISERYGANPFTSQQRITERAACITNFPVPNTKGDLYEFIITSSNNIKSGLGGLDPESKAWKTKCRQCWDKARLLLVDDPKSLQNIQELLLEKRLLKYETSGFLKKERTGRLIWND